MPPSASGMRRIGRSRRRQWPRCERWGRRSQRRSEACSTAHFAALPGATSRQLTRRRIARERFAPMAGLAEGHPWEDEEMWKCRATCDVLAAAAASRSGDACDSEAAERRWLLKASRRRSPLLKRPYDVASVHLEGARALLPRLRRWFPDDSLSDGALVRVAAETLCRCSGVSPCHWVAMIKTWRDGWPTTHRRGLGRAACPACGRGRGDSLGHLILCPALLAATSRASGVAPPTSMLQALSLEPSPPVMRRARHAPPQRLMFLSLQLDTYQKLAGGGGPPPRSRARAAARLRSAALSAHRRIAAL